MDTIIIYALILIFLYKSYTSSKNAKKKYENALNSPMYEKFPVQYLRSGYDIDMKGVVERIHYAELDSFVKSNWKTDLLKWQFPNDREEFKFLTQQTFELVIIKTDGSQHVETIKFEHFNLVDEPYCKGLEVEFTTDLLKQSKEQSLKKQQEEFERRKQYKERRRKIFEGFDIESLEERTTVCTNSEYIDYVTNDKENPLSKIIEEWAEYKLFEDPYYVEEEAEDFICYMDKLAQLYNNYEFAKKSALIGYSGETAVEKVVKKYDKDWTIIKNAVLPIVASARGGNCNIYEFENDIILLCSNAIYTIEIKNYQFGSISIKPDGRVIHKNKHGVILQNEEQNILEQAENHRIYLTKLLEKVCEKHGVAAEDVVKCIIVIANNDFEIEENAINFPIYRPVLIDRAVRSNNCGLSDEMIKDVKEYIEANMKKEHKYKQILRPEIAPEKMEKMKYAINVLQGKEKVVEVS